MTEKYCEWCGELLEKGEYETDFNYNKRYHCGKSCSGKHAAERRKRSKISKSDTIIFSNQFRRPTNERV